MPTRNHLTLEQKVQFCHEVSQRHASFAAVCRAFRIARQTGYKWWRRHESAGVNALVGRSRRPRHCPWQLRPHWIERIRKTRHRFPRWGAKKLHAWLRREFPRARMPAISSIGRVLRRLHLSHARPRRLRGPVRTWPPFRTARRPNEVWTVDFKGWFHTADGVRCEPLTVRDLYSRYGLCVCILPDHSVSRVRRQFVRLFRRYGLPQIIHCDQGGPFGSSGPAHLSRLSAWWISLGITMEYSRRARPGDNGAANAGCGTTTKSAHMKPWVNFRQPDAGEKARAAIKASDRQVIPKPGCYAGCSNGVKSIGEAGCASLAKHFLVTRWRCAPNVGESGRFIFTNT